MSESKPSSKSGLSQIADNLKETIGKAMSTALPYPPLDIYKTDDSVIVVTSSLQGLDPTTLDITMAGNELVIRGIVKMSDDVASEDYLHREQFHGEFRRSVIISLPIKSDEALANFKKGKLTITLPRQKSESDVIGIQITD